MPPRKRRPQRPQAQTEIQADDPEARIESWGDGPLTMPDGLSAEEWIAESETETARGVDELLAELTMKPWYGLQSANE